MPTETQNRKALARADACIDFSSGTPPYSLKYPIVFWIQKLRNRFKPPWFRNLLHNHRYSNCLLINL